MALDLGELVAYMKLDDSEFTSPLDKLPDKIKGKAGLIAGAGAVIGGALAVAFISGVNDALDFSTTNAKIARQLGLTVAESESVGSTAAAAYERGFGESMEQVQSTVGGIKTQITGMGDVSDATLEKMTGKVLTYANTFEVDTADAVQGVKQLMASGLAGSADEAMDLMTSSMQRVPEAMRGDMTDAIGEYGPHLANLGYSGEEAFDLLVEGASKGTYGIDKAGDSMKELAIRGSDLDDIGAQEAFETLGFSGEDMANKLLAGGETARGATDEIIEGLQNIDDPAKQAQAAVKLFGTPLEDMSKADIPAFLESLTGLGGGMKDTEGSASKMTEQFAGGTGNQMTTFNRQIEMLFASLGESLLPVLNKFFTWMNDNPAVMQIVIAALGVLTLAFLGITIATWAMNTALLANPITWIVIGVIALIAAIILLITNWDAVVAWLKDVWDATISWLKDMLSALAEWWSGIWQSISDFFTDLWDNISTWFKDTWNAIVDWFKESVQTVSDFWSDIWNGVVTFFHDLWNGIKTWFKDKWDAIYSWFKDALNAYVTFWTDIWDTVKSTIHDVWDGIKTWFKDKVDDIISTFKSAWDGITGFFTDLWDGIWETVTDWFDDVTEFFEGLPDTIKDFFSDAGSWLWDAGKDLVQGLLDGVKSLAGTVGSFFLDLLPGWIVGPFKAALGINSPSRLFKDYAHNTVQGYLDGIGEMKGELNSTMDNLIDTDGFEAASTFTGSAGRSAGAQDNSRYETHYYAAENQSLSSEEALFEALNSPRVGGRR